MDSKRPSGVYLGVAPEVDSETGDYLFRFPIESPPGVPPEDLFRWAVEEQLRALLDLVELSDRGRPLRVTGYRFLSEEDFRELYTGV